MLALVTCHIFTSSIWYGKKWIPGTWLPGWQLAVFQSPRLHECGLADAHGNAQPFCMDKCIFRKKSLFCNLATRWNKILQFVPSFPIYGWLTWWCDFFLSGPTFENHPQEFGQKRSSPLDFIFDTCASASSSHLFLVGEAEHMWLYPFARTNAFSAKNICFVIWARVDTKFLISSHHVLSVDDWPGDATFFLWGQPLKIIRKYSVKKGPAPWILFLTRAPRPLEVTFFGWWSWTYVVVPFCKDKCIFSKKYMFCNLGARWHKILDFVPSCPICGWLAWRCDFFLVGQPLKIIRKYSVKKGPAPWILFLTFAPRPLQVTFLVGEAEHMWLYPFARTNAFSAKKHVFFHLGARWHKILESVPSCPISGWLAWWCDFFPVGPTFEDHPQVFSQKRSSPLDFIFDPCALASWSHFFGWWRWTYVFVPFCKVM